MKHINPNDLKENFFKTISQEWMLITSGEPFSESNLNTMTANWGAVGWLWNRPVVYIFIRPERYTHQFVEQNDYFSLTFFDEKYRGALSICGEKSGRDCNKIDEAKLTLTHTGKGTPYFSEARLVLECRKFYHSEIVDGEFTEKSISKKWYKNQGVHTMYIAEIENCFYL